MYIDSCKTGKYKRHLLRESYRQAGRVKHRTVGNLSNCTDQQIQALKWALRTKGALPPEPSSAQFQAVSLKQGLSIGAVSVLHRVSQELGLEAALGASQAGKLALWQILARLIAQGSRLSAVRLAGSHAACDVLALEPFCEDELYDNLDWLCENQPQLERSLFLAAHPDGKCDLFLYDVTSTYLEGLQNELAAFGYNRDGKKGKLQLVIGLLCDAEGRPLTIEVFKGNTQDPKTVLPQIRKVAERFGGGAITFVGDRGMLKSKQIEDLSESGFHYITAITKAQIESLLKTGVFTLELFDEDLAEVYANEGVRYVLRRNPVRAKEMRDTRKAKLAAVKAQVEKKNDYLKAHPKAKVGVALRRVEERAKKLHLKDWVRVEEKQRRLELIVDPDAEEEAARLDGCYALKTDLPAKAATLTTVHQRYKDLSLVEWAFRTSKVSLLELRPVYVRLESRTRDHAVVVMLAYLIAHRLRELWQTVELTLEEALEELSTLCLMDWRIDGKTMLGQVPEPRTLVKTLVDLAHVELPKMVVSRGITVSTRKKLVSERLTRSNTTR